MIVKDEAENLPRCLGSVAGVVDEIVVVDTGSTDATLDIAARHGAVTKRIEWPGDFGLARNESLNLATGDWLLVMDADEELDRRDRERLVALVAAFTGKDGPEGALFRIINHLSPRDETPAEVHASLRLFRNRPGYRYLGSVHEQPQVRGPALTSLRIHHWGYLPEVYVRRRKGERNEKLLLDALLQKPDDLFLLYSLAVHYYSVDRWQEARDTVAKVIDRMAPTLHYQPRAVKLLALAEEKCGNVAQAIKVLSQGLSVHPDFTDLLFLRARFRHQAGDLAGALADTCLCLRQGEAPPRYDGHVGLGGRLAVDLLATLLPLYPGRRREVFTALVRAAERAAASGDNALAERAYNLGFGEARRNPGRLTGKTRAAAAHLVAGYIRFLRSEALRELQSGMRAAPWCETLARIGREVSPPLSPAASSQPEPGLPPASRPLVSPPSAPSPPLEGHPLERAGQLPEKPAAPPPGEPAAPPPGACPPTITLCMIVRDEEANLPRCLRSVTEGVDEIIVVDTGSRDATREVAAGLGATVVEFPWNGDFGQARNAGIERASSDWILVLDADEELAPGHAPLLRQLVASNPEAEGFFLRIIDYLGDHPGVDQAANVSFRLFRNRPEHRYHRAIHEQVSPVALERNGVPTVKVCDLAIRHYGYLGPADRAKKRGQRNIALATKDAADLGDPFSHFNLGSEYLKAGRLSQAIEHYREAIEKTDRSLVFAAEARIRAALTLTLLGAHADALAELAEAERNYPNYTDVFFLKGEILRTMGRSREAKKAFERCLELGEAPFDYPTLLGVGTYRAATCLGEILVEMGSPRAALAAFTRALATEPRYLPALLGRTGALLALHGDQARERLEAEMAPSGAAGPGVNLLMGYAWLTALRPAWALPHLLRARADAEHLPPDQAGTGLVKAEALTGVAYFALGRDEDAVIHLSEAGPELPVSVLVLALLATSQFQKARVAATERASGLRSSLLLAVIEEFEKVGIAPGAPGDLEAKEPSPALVAAYSEAPQTYVETALEIISLAAARRDAGLLRACLSLMKPVDSLAPWVRLGKYYFRVGLVTMAAVELTDCLRRGVVDPEAAVVLGDCLAREGRTHEAERAYRQALAWEPDWWRAWFGLWTCLRDRAVTVAREARQFLPGESALAGILEEVLGDGLPGGSSP